MYQLCKRNPLGFTLVWMGIYCIVQSMGNLISAKIGIYKSANMVLALVQSALMLYWLYHRDLLKAFHLKKPDLRADKMLYYLPLLLVSTTNLWLGAQRNMEPAALCIHILLMLSVGFQEELIFRGFLLEALKKRGLKSAVMITSLAFGAGHIVNFFNGSGAAAAEVLMQMLSAALAGYLFAEVCLRCGSLLPCVLSHQMINILGAFSVCPNSQWKAVTVDFLAGTILLLYVCYLKKTVPLPADQDGGGK